MVQISTRRSFGLKQHDHHCLHAHVLRLIVLHHDKHLEYLIKSRAIRFVVPMCLARLKRRTRIASDAGVAKNLAGFSYQRNAILILLSPIKDITYPPWPRYVLLSTPSTHALLHPLLRSKFFSCFQNSSCFPSCGRTTSNKSFQHPSPTLSVLKYGLG